MIYIASFIGNCLGSMSTGTVSDFLVRIMAQKNGGIWEPEFRLVMVVPSVVNSVVGLVGVGWSLQNRAHWIVPTIFFGILGFGSSMASTTAVTFVVDSYKEYAQ